RLQGDWSSDVCSSDLLEPDTQQGALISRRHLERVREYVQLARDEGGRVLCGGTPPEQLPPRCRGGYFLLPAVVTDLDVSCRVNQIGRASCRERVWRAQ